MGSAGKDTPTEETTPTLPRGATFIATVNKGGLEFTMGSRQRPPKGYQPPLADFWSPKHIEIWQHFANGKSTWAIQAMRGEDGIRLYKSNSDISKVKKAYAHGIDPTVPVGAGGGTPTEEITPTLPRGATFIATIKPRVVSLDPRLFVLYDLTQAVFPQYQKTEGEWLFDTVVSYYGDHPEEFELGRLFAPPTDKKEEEVKNEHAATA